MEDKKNLILERLLESLNVKYNYLSQLVIRLDLIYSILHKDFNSSLSEKVQEDIHKGALPRLGQLIQNINIELECADKTINNILASLREARPVDQKGCS